MLPRSAYRTALRVSSKSSVASVTAASPSIVGRQTTNYSMSSKRESSSMAAASRRTEMLGRHMSSSSSSQAVGSEQKGKNLAAELNDESPIRATTNLGARVLTLNRPKALNALNKEMIDLMTPLLAGWEASKSCNIVILKGEGRAFCSGGDVVALVGDAKNDDNRHKAFDFFKSEYEGDRFIAHMKKPVVTFMDGHTMGGGVGLSVHAPFRIATEKTIFAMPETKIGLFPDVGANFFLPRMDGQLGTYLGLTSETLTGYSVFQAGIASHYVPSDRLPALEERLAGLTFSPEAPSTSQQGMQLINSCIEEFVGDATASDSSAFELRGMKRLAIDTCFGYSRAEEIVNALQELEAGSSKLPKNELGDSDDSLAQWAKKTRETLEMRSPTSVKVTLEGIRQGAKMNINEVFDMDMQIATVCCTPALHPDFVTGVTHVLVNKKKDRADWSPSTLSDVSQAHIRQTFFSSQKDGTRLRRAPADRPAYTQYPHAGFALPSEKLIGKVVKGDVKDSGSFAVTAQDVQNWFEREWNGKIGVRQKVEEVLARRTTAEADGTLKWR